MAELVVNHDCPASWLQLFCQYLHLICHINDVLLTAGHVQDERERPWHWHLLPLHLLSNISQCARSGIHHDKAPALLPSRTRYD
jgi:hypothetical protein